jgi:hypothetical protein
MREKKKEKKSWLLQHELLDFLWQYDVDQLFIIYRVFYVNLG